MYSLLSDIVYFDNCQKTLLHKFSLFLELKQFLHL